MVFTCIIYVEGSATIPNHVDGSRNHLDSLLESMNQVEIRESRVTIPTIILVNFALSVYYESRDVSSLIW